MRATNGVCFSCGNTTASIDDVHMCVEECQKPVQRAQNFVQSELQRFQESLQRCVMSCQDEVKDKVTPDLPEDKLAKFREQFEGCAIKCCDANIARLPTVSQKVKDTLKSGRY